MKKCPFLTRKTVIRDANGKITRVQIYFEECLNVACMGFRQTGVEVERGALKIQGLLTLEQEEGGTRIIWRESGDFGWNPLMGFAARGMASSQGDAMRESLITLGQLVAQAGSGTTAP